MKAAMKRSRSFFEGAAPASSSSPPSPCQFLPLPSASTQHASQQHKAIASSDKPNGLLEKRNDSSKKGTDSPSESASSRNTWPVEHTVEPDGKKHMNSGQIVVYTVAKSDRIRLRDLASGSVADIAERLHDQPQELLEELKSELREILGGAGGIQQREEFSLLQKIVSNRTDLCSESLMCANKTHLEILVAIKTAIQAFLHPEIAVNQSVLVEIFFHRRCRNMACQNKLPGDDCPCEVCNLKNGFCNACMCTICSKFDFDVNTCRWIGCDFCSHWTHTDCAIRVGQISIGSSFKGPAGATEMLYRCKACKRSSELIGWVKEVFRACASDWGIDGLMKEFDSVRRIFHGSEDSKGKRLFWKSEELLESLKTGVDSSIVCKEMQQFFQELEAEDANGPEGMAKTIEPHEACSRIAEMVQEAVMKMEALSEEKAHTLKKARVAIEACDIELEEKRKDLGELQLERQRKKREIEELEAIVRLKQAEAEMFQLRADEARREAESLQHIVATKSEKVEEEYRTKYLKLRLNEAEAERRHLFERIQLQEYSRLQPDPSQMLLMCKIQDLLKHVENNNVFQKNNSLDSRCPNGNSRRSSSADKNPKMANNQVSYFHYDKDHV